MTNEITRVGTTGRKAVEDHAEDHAAPVPTPKAPHAPLPVPWTKDDAFGASAFYSAEVIANLAIPSGSRPAASRPWPAAASELPPIGASAPTSIASRCTQPVPTIGNAHVFADRQIPLGIALKDGAFGSAADLARFIDEYLTYTAPRGEMAALHRDASRTGPEILARRLDQEDRESAQAAEAQRMRDRIAPLQVRVPIPLQQRSAVGEIAIPIAKATTAVAKLVPVAGELVILAEVATGRDTMGLGEKLDRAERAVDAALLLAPYAASALAKGVGGAAELLRMSRATGRSVDECRGLCHAAVTVNTNRARLREGIAGARAGRTLTAEERTAMEATAATVEGQTRQRRVHQPTVKRNSALPAGAGRTDKYGNITISPHGTPQDRALALRHESVHAFLSPRAINGLREFRADVGIAAYKNSQLCRYLEEALAETYAQATVNGVRAIPAGLAFPVRDGYVTLDRVVKEGAIGTVVYAGVLYCVYAAVRNP